MIVEVLLHVDDIKVVGGKVGPDKARVGLLVARLVVGLENFREAGDVEGEDAEGAGILGRCCCRRGPGEEPEGRGGDSEDGAGHFVSLLSFGSGAE